MAVNFTNPTEGRIKGDHSPSIKVIIKGHEVPGSIIDGGSGVNVINKITCDRLGIKWETMSILVKNGRYKHSPTTGLNLAIRCHYWWTYIPNMGNSFRVGGIRSLSSIIGSTMATHSQYQGELAKKSSDIPEGQNQNQSVNSGQGSNNMGLNIFRC